MADTHFSDYGQIYFVEHKDTGRVYVGQTTRQLGQRWNEHQKSSYCNLLYRAIKKYGKDRFDIYPVDYANNQLELNAKEVFYIDLLNSASRDFGFNLRAGGSHGKHSDESKQKMSVSVRKAYENPEFKAKLSAAKIGIKHTPERIAKVALANTGKVKTPEEKQRMSGITFARWQDPVASENMRQASIEARKSDDYKATVASNTKAQWADPEQKEKLKAAQAAGKAAFWADPEKKAARIAKRRATIEAKKAAQI